MLHNDWSFQQLEFHWYHPTQGLSTCPPNPLRPTDKLLPGWISPVPFLVLLGWESLLDRNQQCLQFVRQPFHWVYDFQENDKKSRHNDLVELIVQDLPVWWLVPKRLITSVDAQISSAFLTEQTYRKYRLVENWWRLCWGFFWFCDWSTSTSPGISEFWPSEISLSSRCFIKTSTVDVNPYLTVYGSLLIIYIVCCCKDRWLKRILIYFW